MEFLSLNLEYIIVLLYRFFTGQTGVGLGIPPIAILLWDWLKVFSVVASLLLVTGIVYSMIRLSQIRKEEKELMYQSAVKTAHEEHVTLKRDERWSRVLEQVSSENPNDWRQAIIEADTILEDIVTKAGYPGESLGEKMRGIEKSDFLTLDEAWEAHKVRNRIAHDGGSYPLTKREALRVIDLYRKVFEEFFYL